MTFIYTLLFFFLHLFLLEFCQIVLVLHIVLNSFNFFDLDLLWSTVNKTLNVFELLTVLFNVKQPIHIFFLFFIFSIKLPFNRNQLLDFYTLREPVDKVCIVFSSFEILDFNIVYQNTEHGRNIFGLAFFVYF